MLIPAGQLRHRIRIDTQTSVLDDSGNMTLTWTPITTDQLAARMRGRSAQQAYRAGRDEGTRRWEADIRYRADVGTNCRVVWQNRQFDIEGVINLDGRQRYLTLYMLERNSDVDGRPSTMSPP